MRIDELKLAAYGPFTDTVLDLRGGNEGMHLIYGLNEAGKSSALRALRYMFYGIPLRCPDDFLHPYTKMRIGATVRASNGSRLAFLRRKGRVNTLRDADDVAVLEESTLQGFLSGVDSDLFATMFALGYEDLVRGGQDIIQGGGDVGQLVFSAGSGIVNLREIRRDLQEAARELFKPGGSNPKINQDLNRLRDHQKELRQVQLPGQTWALHDAALQKARRDKADVENRLAAQQASLNRLRRIQEALPVAARRSELMGELKAHAGTVILPEEFPEKRRNLLAELGVAEKKKQDAAQAIQALGQSVSELEPAGGLLENAELIESLHKELGSQAKASKDRVRLATMRSGLLAEAKEILGFLGDGLTLEDAETLRIKRIEALNIRKLADGYGPIVTRIEDAREMLSNLSQKIRKAEDDLNSLPPPRNVDELRFALAEAEQFGPLDQPNRKEHAELTAALNTLQKDQHRLGLGELAPEALERLPVPSLERIRGFEDQFEEQRRRLSENAAETAKVENALAEVNKQIETHRLTKEVPTEERLKAVRQLRDRGWRIIAELLGESGVSDEEMARYMENNPDAKTIVDAFGANLKEADHVSDQMRWNADHVAAMARLKAEGVELRDQLQRLQTARQTMEAQGEDLANRWTNLWEPAGIQAATPKEMGQWVQAFGYLVEKLRELRERRYKNEALRADIDAHRSALAAHLGHIHGVAEKNERRLTGLLKKGQDLIEAESQQNRLRERLEQDKDRLAAERSAVEMRLRSNEAELERWRGQWAEAVRPIGLTAGAQPDEAAAVMDELKSLFDKLKEAEILKKRIQGIDRDAEAFARTVSELVNVVAAELGGRSAEEAVLELHQRLKQAREARTKKKTLEGQLALEKKRFEQAGDTIAGIRSALDSMCAEAKCRQIEELPEAERRSNRRRELESALRLADEQLLRLSAGATVEDFVQEMSMVDPDAISGEINRLDEQIDSLTAEKSEIDQSIGRECNELGKMDGSSRAADLAEEIQMLMGSLENDVMQYARLKIAAKILNLAIERYRDKSQGPILTRASALFHRITAGSFEGIRADFDQEGQPMIVGIRPGGGETVTLQGMSEGTADQLYLALRLSGLEMYLQHNEPLPFIVDDILVMFDNDRAAAALEVLADISTKTQVIFFTHHRHLVELAEKRLAPDTLMIHTLGNPA